MWVKHRDWLLSLYLEKVKKDMGGRRKANINGHWIFRIYWGKQSTIRKTERQMQLKTLFFLVSKRPKCIGQVFPLFLLPLSWSSSFLCVDLWMPNILLLSTSIPQEFTMLITLKITCMSKIQIYFSNPVISSSRVVTVTPWEHLWMPLPQPMFLFSRLSFNIHLKSTLHLPSVP